VDGTRSALIVASDQYTDPGLRRLRAPAADAQALAAVLQNPGIGGFEVRTLLNEAAPEVNEAVEEFFDDRRPDDLLLLHFSCHGVKDEGGELYFATTNTKLRRLGATAVAADFVNRRMGRSRSRRIVLLLDCCYAGAFERGMTPRAGSGVAIEEQFSGRGRAVITASSAMEYAFEGDELADTSEQAPSVFTSALVEGLETGEADRDQDGLVALDELYDYVYDRVRAATPNQTPGKWAFGVQGDLYIARRARPVTTPARLPPELQQLVDHPVAVARIAAVQELARLLGSQHAGLVLAARQALERLTEDDSRMVSAAATAALEAKAKQEAEAKAKQEADAKAKQEADAKAKQEADAKAKQEADAKAKQEADAKAKQVSGLGVAGSQARDPLRPGINQGAVSEQRRPDLAAPSEPTQSRLSRRTMLIGAGAAGASVLLGVWGLREIAGKEGAPSQPTTQRTNTRGQSANEQFWSAQTEAGVFDFANWPLYMDQNKVGGKVIYPSLRDFTKETGIKVNYKEVINENDAFLGKITPSLKAGQPTGWDLIVITNGGPLEQLIRENYLVELDHSKLPNFQKNAGPAFKDPTFDPGNKYTIAWQAGLTGLAYNPKLTKRPITSFNDLFDPAFKGKITMFGDTTDFPNLTMVGMGIDPATSTEADWRRAAEKMQELKPQLRGFIDNAGEAKVLSSGNAWISMAYSGDIFILNNSGSPDIKFVIPKEGALLWMDSMAIPKGAKHPLDAITYMDYVYRPEVAAKLTQYIAYITPVPAAKEQLQAEAAKAKGGDKETLDGLISSPLVFPNEAHLANTKAYRVLSPEEQKVWDRIFEPIVQS
jgi:spermidine/putrescine-binding protein